MSQANDYIISPSEWVGEDTRLMAEWSSVSSGSYLPLLREHQSHSNNMDRSETPFNDLVTSIAEQAMTPLTGTRMTQTRGPGPVGQFQKHFTKPLVPFLTMVYLRAESILQAARNAHVFHMQSLYIARQALHLVILLNNLVDAEEGPDDMQQAERVDLEDDLIELLEAMEEWGTALEGAHFDHNQGLLKIQYHYAQIFKERFYFHDVRDSTSDIIYQKLVAYDERTIENRRRYQVALPTIQVEYWIHREETYIEDQEQVDQSPEAFEPAGTIHAVSATYDIDMFSNEKDDVEEENGQTSPVVHPGSKAGGFSPEDAVGASEPLHGQDTGSTDSRQQSAFTIPVPQAAGVCTHSLSLHQPPVQQKGCGVALSTRSGRRAGTRYSPLRPRASRRRMVNDDAHIVSRISNLEPVSQRIMLYYGGNEPVARACVLDKLETHQQQHKEAPVVKQGTQWKCGLCPRTFKTMQKAAIHLTSQEWKMHSWHCLELGCGRVYGSSNELTRHRKEGSHPVSNVNASIQPCHPLHFVSGSSSDPDCRTRSPPASSASRDTAISSPNDTFDPPERHLPTLQDRSPDPHQRVDVSGKMLENSFRGNDDLSRVRRQVLDDIQLLPWVHLNQDEPKLDIHTHRDILKNGLGIVGGSIYTVFLDEDRDSKQWRCLFGSEEMTCRKTEIRFDRLERAIQHVRSHLVHRPFACDGTCDKARSTGVDSADTVEGNQVSITQEMSNEECEVWNATPQGPEYTCARIEARVRCSKTHSRADRFRHHVQGHLGVKPYTCADSSTVAPELKCVQVFECHGQRDPC